MPKTTEPSPQARALLAGGLATLALTAAHHLYGGILYATPWRTHGAFIGAGLALPLWALAFAYRRDPSGRAGRLAGAALIGMTLVFPVLIVGGFEGAYNHLLKNVLFFAGAPRSLLLQLFPPPTYELPNDALFEISGIAQVVTAAWAAVAGLRFAAAMRRGGRRLAPGTILGARRLVAVGGDLVSLPDEARIVHLQLRRFAGCPVCNLHLRSFARRHDEIAAAGIREVVVFHSSADELSAHTAGLPFAVVGDPDKHLYTELGAEAGVRAMLDPRAWPTILLAIVRSLIAIARGRERPPALSPHGGRYGLPMELLIATDGRVLACKYGRHVDDQWSVDELLELVSGRTSAAIDALTLSGSD